jgi:hypothetical protein
LAAQLAFFIDVDIKGALFRNFLKENCQQQSYAGLVERSTRNPM